MPALSAPTVSRRSHVVRSASAAPPAALRPTRAGCTISAQPAPALAPLAVSLRAATSADDREFAVGRALASVGGALAAGRVVEVIWPAAREAAWAAMALGLPLAQAVLALTSAAAPGGAVVIHTRAGSADDFLALAPSSRVSFVVHVNSEEAALRWERGEASPGRRLTAAARLANAGWAVWLCVGPVRLFDGWRDEYADLADLAAAAGFSRLLVSFPGEDLMEEAEAAAAGAGTSDGVQPVLTDSGCRFTVPAKQRREAQTLINTRLAQQARAAA